MELVEDVNGLTAGVSSSRKRGKRRYFWEYSEQLTPCKQERMLKPSEWDRHTLPSNLYQKNGSLHGNRLLVGSRSDLTSSVRSDVGCRACACAIGIHDRRTSKEMAN